MLLACTSGFRWWCQKFFTTHISYRKNSLKNMPEQAGGSIGLLFLLRAQWRRLCAEVSRTNARSPIPAFSGRQGARHRAALRRPGGRGASTRLRLSRPAAQLATNYCKKHRSAVKSLCRGPVVSLQCLCTSTCCHIENQWGQALWCGQSSTIPRAQGRRATCSAWSRLALRSHPR